LNLVASDYGRDEHATVANFSGSRGGDNGLNGCIDDLVRHNGFDLHFRKQRDLVLLAAIHGQVTFLLAMPAHFGDCHPRHIQFGKGVLHIVDLVRSDDALD
jgi:hypothetical protein